MSTQLWWEVRAALPIFIPLLVVVILGFAAAGMESFGLGAITVGAALIWVGWTFSYNYQQDSSIAAASVQVTSDALPEQAQRAPFSVSASQVRSNLGAITGDTQETMYLPTETSFSTLVEKRGTFQGYQTLLSQEIGTTGRNTPSTCDFAPVADRRLGGTFAHSLERAVNKTERWVNWSYSDAYGWCDNGTPKVVIPLKEQEGFLLVTEQAYGVAIYDGKTGEVQVRTDATGIPGPTYPLTLAAEQRDATHAMSGFSDWFFNRAGWELPDEADAVNSDNSAEFVLNTTDGRTNFVTPVTGRGSSTAISALVEVSGELKKPGLNPVVVHQLGGTTDPHPVWQSPGTLTQRVEADFGDVFAVQKTAKIFELAPLDSDRAVATIGTPQNMIYRVVIDGDLATPPCLYGLDGTKIRCGPATSFGAPGVAVGGQQGPAAPGPAPAAADSDLAKLSPQQLADLNRRTSEELARRLAATPAAGS